MRNRKPYILGMTFLLMIPFLSWCQTATKPRYSPRKEKHRNIRDEIDRKQGLWKHYNYLGTLTWEVEYLNDRKHGFSRRYFGNGLIMKETEYEYGIKEGIFRRYNYNGVASEGEFLEGKKSGHWTNYYLHGEKKNEGNYLRGRKQGEWKYFNRKGIEINKIIFREGKDIRDTVKVVKPKTTKILKPVYK
jgi:antitoxin component YwqK of YwqJK toxin-antitoxin module